MVIAGNDECNLRCVAQDNPNRLLLSFVNNGTSCKTVEGYDGTCLGDMCAVSSIAPVIYYSVIAFVSMNSIYISLFECCWLGMTYNVEVK